MYIVEWRKGISTGPLPVVLGSIPSSATSGRFLVGEKRKSVSGGMAERLRRFELTQNNLYAGSTPAPAPAPKRNSL